jgi:hypothetical protein
MLNRVAFVLLILLAAALFSADDPAASVARLQRGFEQPPDDARIMVRWWWFGPAVTEAQLEREMRLMKEGGIGGFEVQPTYPLTLDNAATGVRNLPFLSDEFLSALRFTSRKARELGLRMDLTVGSGWPFGGPQVAVDQAAGRLRYVRVRAGGPARRVPLPDIESGEDFLAAFAAPSTGATLDAKTLREVKDRREGALWLPADLALPAEVLVFISSRSGMQVKRPAVGAEGFVLNHYDRAAVEHYQKSVGDRLMQAIGTPPPYAVFSDSLEVYQSDWTPDLPAEFQKRRGYDLIPHLPALAIDAGPDTPDIRYDWGRTLTELYEEGFARPMRDWAAKYGTRFRIQGYGTPPAALASYALADLPEGEGAVWKGFSTSRWASSASHLLGRPVTSSETWTWLHSPSFRATPLDVKVEADRHFLQGINQLIGHGWPYTAEGVDYPGWRFYAAAVLNDKNPWWIVMPDVSRYLQRASYMLREGTPANDVALYLPTSDAYAQFQNDRTELSGNIGRLLGAQVIPRILESGYNFDFLDDGLLAQSGRVEGGELVFGSARYRAVVLPGIERMPLRTLRTLDQFARQGGILIATRRLPAALPGLQATDAERTEAREIWRRLFEAPGRFVMNESELGASLAARLRPSVSLSPASPEVGFVHRSAPGAEIYFLANTANLPVRARVAIRVDGMEAEWWDPLTGLASTAEIVDRQPGVTVVAAEFAAYGSRFLIFTKRKLAAVPTATAGDALPAPLDLGGAWRVTFGEGGKPVAMPALRSWTEDENTRYFSGVARYEKEISVPGAMLQPGLRLWLDFGEARPLPPAGSPARPLALLDAPVRDAAVLYVNGKRAGSVWCPPFAVEVSGLLKAGANKIEVTAGNLAINHMAGRSLPDYRLLNLRYGSRFDPQDMKNLQPLPSGLLGPIRLVPAHRGRERPVGVE